MVVSDGVCMTTLSADNCTTVFSRWLLYTGVWAMTIVWQHWSDDKCRITYVRRWLFDDNCSTAFVRRTVFVPWGLYGSFWLMKFIGWHVSDGVCLNGVCIGCVRWRLYDDASADNCTTVFSRWLLYAGVWAMTIVGQHWSVTKFRITYVRRWLLVDDCSTAFGRTKVFVVWKLYGSF